MSTKAPLPLIVEKIKRDEQKTVLKSTLMQLKITNAEITALINVIESVIGDEDDGGQG